MVGKKALIQKKRKELREKVRLWQSRPFIPGLYDCVHMFVEIYELPTEWQGYSLEKANYLEEWEKDRMSAMKKFSEFLSLFFDEVHPSYREAYDVVIFEGEGFLIHGIYLGNEYFMAMDEKRGVYVSPVLAEPKRVLRRRWET